MHGSLGTAVQVHFSARAAHDDHLFGIGNQEPFLALRGVDDHLEAIFQTDKFNEGSFDFGRRRRHGRGFGGGRRPHKARRASVGSFWAITGGGASAWSR